MMKAQLKELLLVAAQKAYESGDLNSNVFPEMEIEVPRHEDHGDFSSNFAMVSARTQKNAPRKIAEALLRHLKDPEGRVAKSEIAGPGFINFHLTPDAWHPLVLKVHQENARFGAVNTGQGRKVQVEFVSANPTGPLHVGHGRGAAVGDAVARILSFAGYVVKKEYYINDSGRQIRTLGLSVWHRLQELTGRSVAFPDDCYQGEYIRDLAGELLAREGQALADCPEADGIERCARFAAERILSQIKADLEQFGVVFDRWYSEQSLYDRNRVQDALEMLAEKRLVYEKDGARWFATEKYGDEKDRVVVRQNGLTTYFASDIAYHMEKFERGFDRVIDVWGADHHGYIRRINAAIDGAGFDSSRFDVILVQLVNLLRDGEPVAMSTRAGEFVTLEEIVSEVGRDAARFLFLSRSYDSGLDFDLELAKQQTSENPVYYVQYVHARIASIMSKAVDRGIILQGESAWEHADLSLLSQPEEIRLIKQLAAFPETVEKCADTLHPHGMFTFLMQLASLFHGYYNRHKVMTEDADLSRARLCLVAAVKIVIRNALGLLGVSAPERM